MCRHGDTALMCLSASQIIYSFIMMPSSLPPSYVRFLNKHAAKELWVWRAVKVCCGFNTNFFLLYLELV